ncbi:MAG: helix-hairpin-helix domain-containing protein [Sandaracinus sp.]|nr:helix-hairpin-helix domain-containing protein [Sandaracinus sp.]MCB9632680.1 helix-hairpin-helix domain-containing protein [Sandaracinus sp.]
MNPVQILLRCLFAAALVLGSAGTPAFAQDVDDETTEVAPNATQLDLNTATEAQLVDLPGIGPSKARAILAYREQHPFRRVEDLMRVRGIGRGTFRQLRPLVTVGGTRPATPARGARARRASR